MPAASEVHESLATIAQRLRRGETSATEVVDAALQRIEATDDAVGAFASVQADEARSTAATLDLAAATGRGPLHGVPIAIKDVLHTEGVETAANSEALRGFVPQRDATVVARLRSAGAVIVGKTNTHELAFGVSCPASRNPWDTNRMTGGSSGGNGAAVAARQVFGALGTDTGGSVRIPANYCGITGLKTTRGTVPRDGMHMLSWTYDTIGPMARSAEDCRILFEVIAGPSDLDSYSMSRQLLAPRPVDGITLGVPDDDFLDRIGVDPEVLATMHDAVSSFGDLVSEVQTVTLPDPEAHAEAGSTIVFVEAAAINAELRRTKADLLGDEVRELLAAGAGVDGVSLAAAQSVRTHFQREFQNVFRHQGVDVVIAPVTPNRVLPHGIDRLGDLPLIPATTQFTFPINGIGSPALALPGRPAADGLPIGFQLVGSAFTDHTLLALGEAFQKGTTHHLRAPDL